jgi:hypothetical protein
MKDYHIYLFDNLENLDKTVGFVNIKEQFINNSFVEEAHILLVLSEDFTSRKEIPLAKIQKHLVKGQGLTVPQYGSKYSNQIKVINEYVDRNKISLSWLEIFQLARMINSEENINDSIIKNGIIQLNKFKDIIINKY